MFWWYLADEPTTSTPYGLPRVGSDRLRAPPLTTKTLCMAGCALEQCVAFMLTFTCSTSRRVQVSTALPLCADLEIVLVSATDSDIADLDGGSVAEITFPNPNNLTSFKVKVRTALYSLPFYLDR